MSRLGASRLLVILFYTAVIIAVPLVVYDFYSDGERREVALRRDC